MKTNSILTKALFLGLFITSSILSFSQSYQDSLKKDDDDIVSSIAPYPQDVRDAILDVSQYSQKIVKIERIQSRTSQSFQDMISNYSRDEQAKYYEISRYPDLIHQLVSGPPQTLEQVKPTLSSYPKEVTDAVTFLYPMHLADLTAMDKTFQSSQEAVKKITDGLPSDAQADFKKILGMPDVMNLLTERIDLVVSLGEAYKDDPRGTKSKLDSLSTQINEQNQKDLADYKKQVESDPKMQDEMKQSAQEFADSYSTDGNVSDQDEQDLQQAANQQSPTVVNNYYSTNYSPNPYPYWFGYPYWYASPMWYPRPLYYYTGFYVGVGGNLVVMGMPSHAYSGWFFNYGYRRYPHYYNYCNTYYTAHRTFVNHINVYRGFNTNVSRHFSRVNHLEINRNRNVTVNRNEAANRDFNNARKERMGNSAVNRRPVTVNHNANGNRIPNNNFRNSINQPSAPSHQSFSNFHAAQFHQQSWGSVGGGHPGGGGAPRMGGNGGGGARMGGGGGGGGRGRR